MKIGIIDVGGGMRDIYGCGVFDYLLDKKIEIDYCAGVSAGSANIASYIAKQRGRNIVFYEKYSFEKEYMSFNNYIKNKSFINLDYIYSTLSNEGGKSPLDYDKIKMSKQEMIVVATDAKTAKPIYFTKKDLKKNDYGVIKGSCCIPIVNRPYKWNGYSLYDGGVTDPIPYKKAFNDGCDKLIIVLTRGINYRKYTDHAMSINRFAKKHKELGEKLFARCNLYNEQLDDLKVNYLPRGNVLIIGPENTYGINTLSRNKKALHKLYLEGYEDAKKIEKFLKNSVRIK